MNNTTSLTREQNLHNCSQIISECQEAKARRTTDVSIPHPQTQTSSFIRIVINDISIEVTNLTNPDTLTNVIKAVR